jgi:hypothetical protein
MSCAKIMKLISLFKMFPELLTVNYASKPLTSKFYKVVEAVAVFYLKYQYSDIQWRSG